MLPYWETVIHPLLTALGRGPIVEIGSERGETTARLAELAVEWGSVLHTVDPFPDFDVAELERRFEGHLRSYEEKSHDVLERIGPAPVVLIDGDHNWYTVHGELTRIERIASSHSTPFPLVVLHDVEWPYARRDMYYDPEAIPADRRKPWARRGIKLGESHLVEADGGFNAHLANAVEEGGPQNGVLTAVEDFIEESPAPPDLRIVPGAAGLGILARDDLLDSAPALRRQWEWLQSPEFLTEHAQRLSRMATRMTVARIEAGHKIGELKSELRDARRSKAQEENLPSNPQRQPR